MDIETLLYRVLSGYYFITIDSIQYKIINPSLVIKQQAQDLYNSVLDEYKFDAQNWLSEIHIKHLQNINSIWGNTEEEELKSLYKTLDQLKIQLYLKFSHEKQKKLNKQNIKTTQSRINELLIKKSTFSNMTLKSHAEGIRNEYLIMHMVYDNKGQRIFDHNNNNNYELLEKLISAVATHTIDVTNLRILARSDAWKNLWDAAKDNIFGKPGLDWTDEQKAVVNLSKMYDSIKEHPECPSDEIIADDDALDGWILHNKEKTLKEKKKNQLMDKLDNKYKNAGEVFVMTDSAEEAKDIYSLNDEATMLKIKELQTIAGADGNIEWSKLPSVKREIQEQQRAKIKK